MASVMNDERLKNTVGDLQKLLEERMGKLALTFVPPPAGAMQPPIAHPQKLMETIGNLQSFILEFKRDMIVHEVLIRVLMQMVPEESIETIVEVACKEIANQTAILEVQTRPEVKSPITLATPIMAQKLKL